MADGIIRPSGKKLFDRFGQEVSVYKMEQRSSASKNTIYRWKKDSESLRMTDGEVFYEILINGFGLSVEEVKRLTIEEVFDVITYPESDSEVA